MRKLHQLLPIAREHLICEDHPRVITDFYEEYTCFAAACAYKAGKMTLEEHVALGDAIHEELHSQGHWGTALSVHLSENRDLKGIWKHPEDPAYWTYRDAWLDEFQRKLEREER